MYSLAKRGVSNVTSLFRDVTIELYARFQSLLPPLLSMVKETKKRLVNVQQVGKSSSIILVRIAGMLICTLHGSCTDLEYM